MTLTPSAVLRRLLEERDLAAYRAVAVIQSALDFWESQDYESAFRSLERAREDFMEADARITQFRKSNTQGETARHGNSISAA